MDCETACRTAQCSLSSASHGPSTPDGHRSAAPAWSGSSWGRACCALVADGGSRLYLDGMCVFSSSLQIKRCLCASPLKMARLHVCLCCEVKAKYCGLELLGFTWAPTDHIQRTKINYSERPLKLVWGEHNLDQCFFNFRFTNGLDEVTAKNDAFGQISRSLIRLQSCVRLVNSGFSRRVPLHKLPLRKNTYRALCQGSGLRTQDLSHIEPLPPASSA